MYGRPLWAPSLLGSHKGCPTRSTSSSDPVAGAPAPEVAALLAHEAGEHHVVHFRGAVDEPGRSRRAINPFEHRVLGIAARAIELDADVGCLLQRVGDLHLGHGHFLARAISLIELPGRMHGEQAADLDLVRHLAELDLHALAVGKPYAEAFAPRHVVLGDLHATLRPAEPAHAVGEACRAEPDLRHPQPVADAEQ